MEKADHTLSDVVMKNEKKANKDRAKEHRERKKLYINSLEEQVIQLKAQIVKLEEENKELKGRNNIHSSLSIGTNIDSLLQRLEYESQYAQEVLPNMIKDNPDQVRFSMIEQTNDTMGSYGSYRIQLIKDWFKLIIENIIDDRMKAVIAWINNLPLSKFCNMMKPSKSGKDKNKRFKISEETEIIRLAGDIQFSEEMSEEWVNGSKFFKKEISKLSDMMNGLVKMRNNILNHLRFLQDYWNRNEEGSKYTKSDFISISTFANRFKNTKYTNLFNLWNIPRKSDSSWVYIDNEMTDDEDPSTSQVESNSIGLSKSTQ